MKYAIEKTTCIAPGEWVVKYKVWEGCACGAFKIEARLKNTFKMPGLSEVMRYHETTVHGAEYDPAPVYSTLPSWAN